MLFAACFVVCDVVAVVDDDTEEKNILSLCYNDCYRE